MYCLYSFWEYEELLIRSLGEKITYIFLDIRTKLWKNFFYTITLLVSIKNFVTFSILDILCLIAYDLNIIAALIPSGQEINAKTTSLSRYMWIKESSSYLFSWFFIIMMTIISISYTTLFAVSFTYICFLLWNR